MQNPIQTYFQFKIFQVFFRKINFFFNVSFRTLYSKGEKHEVREKIIFYCSFIVQNPFQTILRFQKFFKFFFPTINFHCFEPYTAKVRKVKPAKNNFLVLFYSAKSVSDHFTISKLSQVFFRTIFFFTVSNPILQR